MNDGGYSAKNGARFAPQHRIASSGSQLGDDFPMVCETCLGPNPYVRMTKFPFGHKLCKISNLPYQAFKWKAGPGGRYKETMVSFPVAAERNICQTCLLDMKYGLPVGVRDTLLGAQGSQVAIPQSDVGQQYYYENQANLLENGQIGDRNMIMDLSNAVASRQLDRFSKVQQSTAAASKTTFRNLPKLCSFWLLGGCTRVLNKTCPFRPCCGEYTFPEIAGSHRELYMKLQDRLRNEGPAAVMKSLDPDTRTAIQEAQRGNRDDAIRRRVSGEDDLTKKYLGKMKGMNTQLEPPADRSIVTLWIGNIEDDISEADIRGVIYPYGQIASFALIRNAKCAFVEYVDREAAEGAAAQLYNSLVVNGRALNVNWAKPKGGATNGGGAGDNGSSIAMLPPPGMEKANPAAYSLKGMSAPVTTWPPLPPGSAPPQSGAGSDDADGIEVPAAKKQRADNNASNSSTNHSNNNKPKVIPPPPPGPPPASASLLGGLADYGDDDEEVASAAPAATAVPAPGSNSKGSNKRGSAGTQPSAPKAPSYPSMNPSRMGSAL